MFRSAVAKHWPVSLFAIVGALGILVHGGSYLLHHLRVGEFAEQVGKEFPSPDGNFKAVLFNANGGGAISPYCYDAISVVQAGTQANGNSKSERVYLAGCHAFVDKLTNNRTNGPKIRWLANDRLEITFSANQAAMGVSELTLKGWAAGGKVRMVYVVTEWNLTPQSRADGPRAALPTQMPSTRPAADFRR